MSPELLKSRHLLELADEYAELAAEQGYDCVDTEQAHNRIDKLAEAVRNLIAALKADQA